MQKTRKAMELNGAIPIAIVDRMANANPMYLAKTKHQTM